MLHCKSSFYSETNTIVPFVSNTLLTFCHQKVLILIGLSLKYLYNLEADALFFPGSQSLGMMSVLYKMCTQVLMHKGSRVLEQVKKESAPVARQPQPSCSLAYFRPTHTCARAHTYTHKHTEEITCGNAFCPLFTPTAPTLSHSYFPKEMCFNYCVGK